MKTKFNNSTIQQFNNRGFTIIELIVVFSVIAILSTIGVASFVDYSRAQALQQATNDFVNVLNIAKSRAYSQNKSFNQNGVTYTCLGTLGGYFVKILLASNQYQLGILCSGSDILGPPITFPQNVVYTGSGGLVNSRVFFNVLTGGVSGGAVIIKSYSSFKTVTVDSVGIITVL